MILADRGGAGEALGDFFAGHGHRYRLLYADEVAPVEAGETRWRQLQQSVSTVLQNGISPVTGIVSFWGLDIALPTQPDGKRVAHAAALCHDTLHLVQSLATESVQAKLWLVTQCATSLATSQAGLFQSPLWGLGKVVALEHPDLWGGLIDLDEFSIVPSSASASSTRPSSTRPEIASLAMELLNAPRDGETQVAFRGGQRYVARLVPHASSVGLTTPLVDDAAAETVSVDSGVVTEAATYLITGGLGALGLTVADWLVKQGARHLVLVGRRAPADPAAAAIRALTDAGATVLPLQADVTVTADMARVFSTIQDSLPPLKGVIHAAGTVSYELIETLTVERLNKVLAPKVEGAWILHQLTQG